MTNELNQQLNTDEEARTANNGYKALLLINYFFKDKSNAS